MTLRKEDTQICKRFHVQGTTSPFFTELHQKYDFIPLRMNHSRSKLYVRPTFDEYHLMQRLVTTLKLRSTDYSELFIPTV